MEEGELKKRILSTFVFGIVHQKPLSVEVDEILDECRKEFPAWYIVPLPECEGLIYKWNEMTEEQQKIAKVKSVDVDEAVVWFEKWFGGEQK